MRDFNRKNRTLKNCNTKNKLLSTLILILIIIKYLYLYSGGIQKRKM